MVNKHFLLEKTYNFQSTIKKRNDQSLTPEIFILLLVNGSYLKNLKLHNSNPNLDL